EPLAGTPPRRAPADPPRDTRRLRADVHGCLRGLQRAADRGRRPSSARRRDLQADLGAHSRPLVGGERDRRGDGGDPGAVPQRLHARRPARGGFRMRAGRPLAAGGWGGGGGCGGSRRTTARAYGRALWDARLLLGYTLLVSLTLGIGAPFLMIALRSVGKGWFGRLWLPPQLTLEWYRWAVEVGNIGEVLRNTLIIGVIAVCISTT